MLPDSERARWALVVALVALALSAVHIWWVATYRYGYPLNVDEAGYTSIGLIDYIGFKTGGLQGWWDAVQTQTPNAPLVPAITSIVLLIKPGVMEGFGVLIGFFVILTLATYGIGDRLAGPRLGALAALIVATSQGAFIFVREYVFALPTGALLACTVYALIRSEGLRSRGWSIGAGVAIGLMMLARTMAVAFVPGIFAAIVIVSLARDRQTLATRTLNLGLMAVAAAVTAATWYWRNLQPVIDYLTNFGYGTQSNYYGAEQSTISWGRFRSVFDRMIFDDLLIPFAALLLLGLITLAVLAIRRVIQAKDRRATLLQLVGSNAFLVALVFAAGYAALMSSQNGGNGFTYPLTVLLPPLAVVALRFVRAAVIPAVSLVALIAVLNIAANTNLSESLSRTRFVEVPLLGAQPWISGIPHTVAAIRVQAPGPAAQFDSHDKGWTEDDKALADLLIQPIGPDEQPPIVAFASRNRVISSNSVGLAALLTHQRSILFTQLNAEPTDTVGTYMQQLTDPELVHPTAIVTMNRNTDDFPPLVTQSHAEAAARRLDFAKVRTMTLPDGRVLRVWVKRDEEPALASCGSSRKAAEAPDCPPGNPPG